VTDALPPYEPLPEDWARALVVVAHPDDIEYGTAAAVARWTAQGKEVAYCLATRGEAGIDSMPPEQAGPLREAEERAGAKVVGVDAVEFLDHRDGVVEYGLPLRADIARVIRRHRPDIVVTGNFRDVFPGGFPNQADHIAVGRAALDAVRDAGNRWVFPGEGGEPWNGVRAVWTGASPMATHAVDVSDTFHIGMQSLRAHEAYLAGLGEGFGFDQTQQFLERFAREAGARLGCTYAIAFEVLRLRFE
jgi:LmbE family N-acetylglucosaminyl deacetylase